jgi:hypothetical protein
MSALSELCLPGRMPGTGQDRASGGTLCGDAQGTEIRHYAPNFEFFHYPILVF